MLTLDEPNANKIFHNGIKEQLLNNEYIPLMPPELKGKKSVIITRVDDIIFEWDVEEIFDEIKTRTTGLETSWTPYVNSQTHLHKITFKQTALAIKCTEVDMKAFNLIILPRDIQQETFVPIKTCMRCYKLEKHNTRDSTQPRGGRGWPKTKFSLEDLLNCIRPVVLKLGVIIPMGVMKPFLRGNEVFLKLKILYALE